MGFEWLGAWHVSAVPRSVPELRRALLATIAGRGFDEAAVGTGRPGHTDRDGLARRASRGRGRRGYRDAQSHSAA